jgi:hypothetical protein
MQGEDPYSRQRRLPEVGDLGQARLLSAHLIVAAGAEARSEAAYLERAGVGEVLVSALHQPEPFAHAAHFRHAASSELAAGAWRALRKLLATLGTS